MALKKKNKGFQNNYLQGKFEGRSRVPVIPEEGTARSIFFKTCSTNRQYKMFNAY